MDSDSDSYHSEIKGILLSRRRKSETSNLRAQSETASLKNQHKYFL